MRVEQAILDGVRSLPFDKQREILSHATRLRDESAPERPFRSIKSILAGRRVSISADDIDEVWRGMGKNFPREDIRGPRASPIPHDPQVFDRRNAHFELPDRRGRYHLHFR